MIFARYTLAARGSVKLSIKTRRKGGLWFRSRLNENATFDLFRPFDVSRLRSSSDYHVDNFDWPDFSAMFESAQRFRIFSYEGRPKLYGNLSSHLLEIDHTVCLRTNALIDESWPTLK